jgi:hypothetical protein
MKRAYDSDIGEEEEDLDDQSSSRDEKPEYSRTGKSVTDGAESSRSNVEPQIVDTVRADRKSRRRELNRLSKSRCRKHRKDTLHSLEVEVERLTADHRVLQTENEALRRELYESVSVHRQHHIEQLPSRSRTDNTNSLPAAASLLQMTRTVLSQQPAQRAQYFPNLPRANLHHSGVQGPLASLAATLSRQQHQHLSLQHPRLDQRASLLPLFHLPFSTLPHSLQAPMNYGPSFLHGITLSNDGPRDQFRRHQSTGLRAVPHQFFASPMSRMHLHAEQGRTSPSTSTGMPSDQDGSAAVRNNLGHHALPLM